MGEAEVEDVPAEARPALDSAEHDRLVALVAETAVRDPDALAVLWREVVAAHGTLAASRVWQEALAATDAEQQT
jgi:hypothetical protein